LFVERARQVAPDFALTEATAVDVHAICRRLDGLPLAIELAAARAAMLPPAALFARLERRLPLLIGGARDAPARLRTMHDAIAWSYDLLPSAEQTIFRSLSVFLGSFTLDAAQAVAVNSPDSILPSDAGSVFEGIQSLIDKSLLRAAPGAGQAARFTMLDTIREYGLVQLEKAGEVDMVRRRHADFHLAEAERAAPEFHGPAQQAWWDHLDAGYADHRAAVLWFIDTEDGESALRAASSLAFFWYRRGHLRDGRALLQRAWAHADTVSPALRSMAINALVHLSWTQGIYDDLEHLATQSAAIADRHGPTLGTALTMCNLGEAETVRGNFAAALPRMVAGLDLLRKLGREDWLAYFLNDLGAATSLYQDPPHGMAMMREALALHRARGNRCGAAIALSDLGIAAHDTGDERAAAGFYRESLVLFAAIGDEWYFTGPLAGLANIAAGMGQMEPAAQLLGAAATRRTIGGAVFFAYETARFERTVAAARALLGEERFAAAYATGCALPLALVIAVAQEVAEARLRQAVAPGSSILGGPPVTERERQVLQLLSEGHADRAIAARLSISHRTVMHHVTSLLAKLDVDSRTAAATKAVRLGLVDPERPTPDR
jgi:predicted ATPase/DNA-binding CsgD family transcriptional regulator